MKISSQPIKGVYFIELDSFEDKRGSFSRVFCTKELNTILNKERLVQINISKNFQKGLIRGIHYQKKPYTEIKLINCIKGKIYDVVVDLRSNSNTFLKWCGYELSENDNKMLFIPKGCAHGFQTLTKESSILYLHSEFYSPSYERGLNYKDPKININWPLPISEVSSRDQKFEYLNNKFKGI
tara:strand:+ start:111 stop:656 length:546 start_codon:yes stop_codon:yes gene_type:complete